MDDWEKTKTTWILCEILDRQLSTGVVGNHWAAIGRLVGEDYLSIIIHHLVKNMTMTS